MWTKESEEKYLQSLEEFYFKPLGLYYPEIHSPNMMVGFFP